MLEKQLEEIDQVTKRIELLEQYKSDYQKLKKLILNMQEKVAYPHRIPIAGTQLAFVPGRIIHTNELTVLLGDNYFALRSARQADGLIDRRLNNLNERLKANQDAKRKTEEWFKISEEHKREKDEYVEIIETM